LLVFVWLLPLLPYPSRTSDPYLTTEKVTHWGDGKER
jgi:hypothetical protein